MTCLRYEEKTAKKDHKRTCDITAVPIEKGDRFMSIAGIMDGDFSAYKAHQIIHDICNDQNEYNEPYQLRNQAQGVAIQWFQGKEPVPKEAAELSQRWCLQFGGCSEVVIAAYAHYFAGL